MIETPELAPPALVVESLTKRYGGHVALDGVTFAVPPGGIYGFAGPNGGGKSTLLRILATHERPSAGRIVVCGRDAVLTPSPVRRLIGYAGPTAAAPELTVAEELDFAADLAGVPRPDRAEAVATMLELVDLHDRRHRPVGQLSRGDLKRLAVARALVHDPAVLLLDGPLDDLDGAARGELRAVLGELAALGKALVVTAGTFAELAGLCHEVGLLDRGRLLLSGPADAVLGGDGGRPLRLVVAGEPTAAEALLAAHPLVRDLATTGPDRLLFRFAGGVDEQAALVAELLRAGVPLVELAPAHDEAEATLTRLVRTAG